VEDLHVDALWCRVHEGGVQVTDFRHQRKSSELNDAIVRCQGIARFIQQTSFDISFSLLERYGWETARASRHAHCALRHALHSPAYCTITHFLPASSEENAPRVAVV
jgi:hypothetical protein